MSVSPEKSGQTSGARQSPIRFPYQYAFGRTAVRPYKKCMILNWITDQEDRLPALHALPVQHIFCSSRSLGVWRIVYNEPANVSHRRRNGWGRTWTDVRSSSVLYSVHLSVLFWANSRSPLQEVHDSELDHWSRGSTTGSSRSSCAAYLLLLSLGVRKIVSVNLQMSPA